MLGPHTDVLVVCSYLAGGSRGSVGIASSTHQHGPGLRSDMMRQVKHASAAGFVTDEMLTRGSGRFLRSLMSTTFVRVKTHSSSLREASVTQARYGFPPSP